jgi:hypothetical protein
MTFRTRILAGLVATLAGPAMTYASSSGLTKYDLEHGQTTLLSDRGSVAINTKDRKVQGSSREKVDISTEQFRHREAMETGAIRMTTGSMEGTAKQ